MPYNDLVANFWAKLQKPISGLAPMDGITDWPGRQVQCLVGKPAVLYTEFVSVEGLVRNPTRFQKTLKYSDNERPIIAQLFGKTPTDFATAGKIVVELGFDGIDINLGCPARKVFSHGGGAALINNQPLVGQIITDCLSLTEKVKIPLSVKTRLGKKKLETQSWFSFLSQFPLAAIAIHGRLVGQGLNGEVNWPQIGLAAQIIKEKRPKTVVLGNGGIKSLAEGKKLADQYRLAGFLIGQAACGNPWIFTAAKRPSREVVLEIMLKHAFWGEKHYNQNCFNTLYKHFCWYLKGLPHANELKAALIRCRNGREVQKAVTDWEKLN